MRVRRVWLYGTAGVMVLAIGLGTWWLRSGAIPDIPASGVPPDSLTPTFDGADATRERLAVSLTPVIAGLTQPTDVQFVPGRPTTAIVLEKEGRAVRADLTTGETSTWFRVDVASRSEMGLLGLAFAPDFEQSGHFVVHLSPPGARKGRIELWKSGPDLTAPARVGTILEVDQPYSNHDGGQVAFGPDGHLYVGLGDGGSANDPEGNGQNGRTLLGSLLRISPRADGGYDVPPDNPFLADEAVHDAAFAIGLRNPWRFSFDPAGRLVVADVGQNTWEEIDLVPAGANLGWNLREGRHCFRRPEPCTDGLLDPVWEYDHDEGVSITGGYVHTGSVAALRGRYLFGDFGTGRLWALSLPDQPGAPASPPAALGRWPISPSTFGRDAAGEVYVADFMGGTVYRIAAK